MLKPSQRRTLEKAVQTCEQVGPAVAWLQAVAAAAPEFSADVQEIVDMRDHLSQLAAAALAAAG